MAATDGNAAQDLIREDARTRPPTDLLARVPLDAPGFAVDLGCGPGNGAAPLVRRRPRAEIRCCSNRCRVRRSGEGAWP